MNCANSCGSVGMVAHLGSEAALMGCVRRVIEEGDPKAELLFRVDDMLRETRAAIAKATGNQGQGDVG